MKIKTWIAASLMFIAATIGSLAEEKMPMLPTANFSATPKVIQTGTYPTLNWEIFYPRSIKNVANISPNGTIEALEDVYISVRPLGVELTGPIVNGSQVPTEIRVSLNGANYERIFFGNQDNVDPAHPTYIKKLNKGNKVNFGGRYIQDGEWTPFYTTQSVNNKTAALIKGDMAMNGEKAEYLKPYVDSANKVRVGPLSYIVAMELAANNQGHTNFDYKDTAVFVSFSKLHPNNGHGNNIDGVDSSNPSVGQGGPNGTTDPSGGVDDEKK